MSDPLRIGLAGLGTVGCGVVKILQKQAEQIEQRAGRPVRITAVSARNKGADRCVDVSAYDWVEDPVALALRDDVDVVVELIGGEAGVAKDLAEACFANKKHFITANKAMLAHHGVALAAAAEKAGVALAYEAAVAGGIPVIKTMREGLAGNDIISVQGILNGTCNYILSTMRETGRSFGDVLKEAQDKGYAEADPSFDIGGVDAAHKLAILTALAFGVKPDFEALSTEGIESITAQDIAFATELGYRIKLIGLARKLDDDSIVQSVAPCFVPVKGALGSVEGVFNAVLIDADPLDTIVLEGRGAGEGPTASAVVSDIIDIAAGSCLPCFGVPVAMLKEAQWASADALTAGYYIRLQVDDKPGVIATISAALRDHDISIESLIQRGHDDASPVSVVIVTHDCKAGALQKALDAIAALPAMLDKPCVLRIEEGS